MARPCKCRNIANLPGVTYFKPRGIPMTELDEVIITLDEIEAVRLADLDGLYQEEAADRMKISRQTFGNIIHAAHAKIAEAILKGKAMKIEGGVYRMKGMRTFVCHKCAHPWDVPYGTGRPTACPQCKSTDIQRAAGQGGRGRRQGMGRCVGRNS